MKMKALLGNLAIITAVAVVLITVNYYGFIGF